LHLYDAASKPLLPPPFPGDADDDSRLTRVKSAFPPTFSLERR
jgi:hypothetical protein